MESKLWGEELKVHIEPKFAVRVEKDRNIAGHLKKGARRNFFFFRSDNYLNCTPKISGKSCSLKDGEGLHVPCKLLLFCHFTERF